MPNVAVLALDVFAFLLALGATSFTRSVAQIERIPDADIHHAYKNVMRRPLGMHTFWPAGTHYFTPSIYYDTISWQCAIVPQ